MDTLTVVAYYTEGMSYEREAALLCASLDRAGMYYEVTSVPSQGDWYANTARKATFLREERARLAGPLLYVDVDAFVHQDCAGYFEQLAQTGIDFGAHWFAGPSGGYDRAKIRRNPDGTLRGWWMLSGTLLLGDTPLCRELLDAWCELNEWAARHQVRMGGGQKRLWFAANEMNQRLKIARLPGRYCYVFDKGWSYPADEPCIIEHTIASREHRDRERHNQERQKRIDQLWDIVKERVA